MACQGDEAASLLPMEAQVPTIQEEDHQHEIHQEEAHLCQRTTAKGTRGGSPGRAGSGVTGQGPMDPWAPLDRSRDAQTNSLDQVAETAATEYT